MTPHSKSVISLTPLGVELAAVDPQTLLARGDSLRTEPGTLHIWDFALEGTPDFVALCRTLLSPQERQRADRFAFTHDRTRHIVAHAVLRHLLSLYCQMSPESLRFTATANGKPSLLDNAGTAARSIHFNLTHSEDRALLGVSEDRELGIDLEKIRSNIEALDISRHYFFGSEREAIQTALPAARDSTFFRYWVAKEAVLKAQGIGLGFPLDRFRIDFLPGGEAARIETLDPNRLAGDWNVRMLPCEPTWLAAVAARGTDWAVKVESR